MKTVITIRQVFNGWIIEKHEDFKTCLVITNHVREEAHVFESIDRAIAYLRKEMAK
jgi:hypothetical protein